MFANLGRTLGLLRELRGKSQARIAREAGIGKSQLSKYENGKELPKFDSLEKVLNALEVGQFEFFYTLYLVDDRASELSRGGRNGGEGERPSGGEGRRDHLYLPPLLKIHPLLSESTDRAFSTVFADLLFLYRQIFEQVVFAGAAAEKRGDDAKAQ
ncbi:MAG TPA: helix-turn-helix transcriptional regulator [Thermoanaerobaculia bacterium]|nr:helix-turn-helix transcriptional regulator [Thermoanaerobaculia bacterium]